jgi:hypothetical protein
MFSSGKAASFAGEAAFVTNYKQFKYLFACICFDGSDSFFYKSKRFVFNV